MKQEIRGATAPYFLGCASHSLQHEIAFRGGVLRISKFPSLTKSKL